MPIDPQELEDQLKRVEVPPEVEFYWTLGKTILTLELMWNAEPYGILMRNIILEELDFASPDWQRRLEAEIGCALNGIYRDRYYTYYKFNPKPKLRIVA